MSDKLYPLMQQTELPLAYLLYTSELYFHKRLMNDTLPLSIGGGIGQSRLCMFYLRKAHIGDVYKRQEIWRQLPGCTDLQRHSGNEPFLEYGTSVEQKRGDVYKRQ